ncbi:MAG: hypothetical protein DDT30_01488 [Dehalococcoidia bacterium]|nr:hypothetical protein [Bacillota bacterium]MBT9140902.1 hypothetical protein [Bacillota bacterium]
MKRRKLIFTHPAVLSTWAALYAAAALLPATPVIGIGGHFSLSSALMPLAGIFFGPWAGGISVAAGAFIGQLIAPHTAVFGLLTFIIPTIGAMGAGLAMQRRWIWPLAAILALASIWYLFPLGRAAWFFPFIGLLGSLAIAVGWLWGSNWLTSETKTKMFAGVFVTALTGIMVDHSLGSLLALHMFALPKEVFLVVLPIAPVERLLFALGAAIIGVPLIVGLSKVGIIVGPKIYKQPGS